MVERSAAILDTLVGEQLSAIIFVQDYLQIDFDGKRLTFNVWPVIRVNNEHLSFNDRGYRDTLCSLIRQKVAIVSESPSEICVVLEKGALTIDLTQESPIEHAIFEDTISNQWGWW